MRYKQIQAQERPLLVHVSSRVNVSTRVKHSSSTLISDYAFIGTGSAVELGTQ